MERKGVKKKIWNGKAWGWRSGAMPLERDVAEETGRTGGRVEIKTDQTRAFALKNQHART